jgi:flagellum-specific ATP synthase
MEPIEHSGRVTQIVGLTVESAGPSAKIGDVCEIYDLKEAHSLKSEVVGFRDNKVLLMPFGDLSGIGPGSKVISINQTLTAPVGMNLRGRILDALGNPMDGKGSIVPDAFYPIENDPPNPLERRRIKDILPLGVKSIDSLLTMGRGQRIGIFAGSGVGKSTLMGMIARNATADVNVITLIGERGREVLDFVEKDLKEEGLKRSVLVIATSDQPALVRLKSAYVGTAIAEYFRDQGLNVLLLMDSLTRFAMAQREIGMATGEPPVSRGFPPSVYAKLPRLLERSGTNLQGAITGLYTVLVEGDDMNEPVADTVRGILDGHFVMTRQLANNNHYPPIDVLQSVSRLMPDIVDRAHLLMANRAKSHIATYREAQDLINIGAYVPGSNPAIDRAIKVNDPINKLLRQEIDDSFTFDETLELLRSIVGEDVA